MCSRILWQPLVVTISISKPPQKLLQHAFVVYEKQKIPLVQHVLHQTAFESVLIFCAQKQNVKQLSRTLKAYKFSVEEIHSDLEQDTREQVLLDFKNRKTKILIATDILSRGIDIEDIDLVINYDVPRYSEDYIHRIGRTARASGKGIAYTFVTEREQKEFSMIEKLLGHAVTKAKVPVHFGE